ncbi:MAG: EAL domain-containing protein [Gammaproteobacteria bacterium]|nr:EAL domain-containing protein [Gammaproteobacteria bacterium]
MYDKKLEVQIKQLEIERTFQKNLIHNIPDLIWMKDLDGVYLACNAEFELFFGKSEQEIVGKTDYDFVDEKLADFFREHDKKALQSNGPCKNNEWINYAADGRRILLETIKTVILDDNHNPIGVLGLGHDITERYMQEITTEEINQRYEAVINSTSDGFWLVNMQGKIIEVNESYCHESGFSQEEILNKYVWELDACDDNEAVKRNIRKIKEIKRAVFETTHRKKDGTIWNVEVSSSYSDIQEGYFFSFIRNICERKLNEKLAVLRVELSELVYKHNEIELLKKALDHAELLTNSQIGFFHYVEDDQETVSLQTWSSKTFEEMCFLQGDSLHYPISEAGIWADCIDEKKAVIHNDYESLPHKKGLPEGHTKLLRELTVPIFRENKIVAVIGLGNKLTDYNQADVEIVNKIGDISYDFIEKIHIEKKIKFLAYNDVLTGLPNRELFADRLQQGISAAKRNHTYMALCYIDLDGFKPINDQYGHDAGDLLLTLLAYRLTETSRESDTIARIGGDEFVLLLNDLDDIFKAEEIAERILQIIAEPYELQGQRVHVSASIGITIYPLDDSVPDGLLRHADQAMYRAKENGKNTYQLYNSIEDQKVRKHRKMLKDIEKAIEQSQLVLFYQPRVSLETMQLVGVEALVRWNHPKEGILAPFKFLPYIENTPLEIALDEWVLKTAIEQHLSWIKEGLIIPVSVNISPRHIDQDTFPGYLKNVLAQYPDLNPDNLELEVLETGSIDNTVHLSKIMNACKELGVSFSLDDFGTGYSSLTYFHRLPISILKIDRDFVLDMINNSEVFDIVEGVIRLADALNRPVVAEGVESLEHGLMLMQLGCQYIQGYGLGKPMPVNEFSSWINNFNQHIHWQNLQNQAFSMTYDNALNVAIYAIQHCLLELKMTFESDTAVNDQSKFQFDCYFNTWYGGLGQSRFGHMPQYAFIPPKFASIQKLSEQLNSVAIKDGNDKAMERFEELEVICNEFITMLSKLSN